MAKSKKRRPKPPTPGETQKRFDRLIAQLARSKDTEHQNIIRKELAHVARMLNGFSREAKLEGRSGWMPKSYIEQRQTKIETAAHISGRRTIRAHMVQGGTPGGGKGR